MKWSSTMAVRRLSAITGAVPAWESGGARSVTVAAAMGCLRDLEILRQLTHDVTAAIGAPTPDPEWGDGGVRESQRETALAALDWAEQWIEARRSANWASDHRSLYLRVPSSLTPESPCPSPS